MMQEHVPAFDGPITRARAKELQENLTGMVLYFKSLRELSPPPHKTVTMVKVL